MKKIFYIIIFIYYIFGLLYIGYFYCIIVVWIFVNYKKILGYDVKFLIGSDEYG